MRNVSPSWPHPSWSAERIQRKAIRQAQIGQCLVFIVQKHKGDKREAFPELGQGSSKRVRPGPNLGLL